MPTKIYLTIDDCPSESFDRKIAFLSERHIPAILFCRGDELERRQDAVPEAIRAGFVIGNHSWSHPKFSKISIEEARDEIEACERLIESAYAKAGVRRPAELFRFPYGDRGGVRQTGLATLLRLLGFAAPVFPNIGYARYNSMKYAAGPDVFWTIEAREYLGLSANEVLAELDGVNPEAGGSLSDPKSDDILLIHDHDKTTPVFEQIIERLLDRGHTFDMPCYA